MRRDVYSGTSKLHGEQNKHSLAQAFNYGKDLIDLQRFEEAKSLLRKTIPLARRVLGEGHRLTLMMRSIYANALYRAEGATLDDVREAVKTYEDAARIARRVFGGAHPLTEGIEHDLQQARAALRARETPEKLAQEAFRTARAKLAQERSELADAMAAMRTGDA